MRRRATARQAETRFPFTVLRGMPYSDLPLRKELVVRREVREPFFKVLKHIPRCHLEGLTEIIAGRFQDKSMFVPDGTTINPERARTALVLIQSNLDLAVSVEIGGRISEVANARRSTINSPKFLVINLEQVARQVDHASLRTFSLA